MLFTPSIERALRTAFEAHSGQQRKGCDVPYVSHPVHVAMLLARDGADDVTLQAALLHDVVEDCEGWTFERLELEFGAEVTAVVRPLTEPKGEPWEVRKQAALDHVPTMDHRAAGVKAADKTHNMRSLVERLEDAATPELAWQPFTRGPEQTIDFAERLVDALEHRLDELAVFPLLRGDMRAAFEALRAHR